MLCPLAHLLLGTCPHAVSGGDGSPGSSELNGGAYDFTSKLLHLAWHPQANVIACAASNSLYMYYA
jgi:serine/threonine-protein phosphatase 2A regulatory subunit B